MTIKQIYNLALEMGISSDPRGKKGVEKWLLKEKTRYSKLSRESRELFDRERLTNPYSDTRIHYFYENENKKNITTILAGIDIETPEIALISSLPQFQGPKKPDLLLTHHPLGRSLAELSKVMPMQAEIFAEFGVPINIAEGVTREHNLKIERGLSPINHMREIDAAKLAKISLMNIHTPTDNLVFQFLQKLMDRKKPETVGEIVDILLKVPEYKIAAQNGAGPKIVSGSPESSAGKILALDVTGGTGSAKEIYPELSKAGVGTIIGMHMREESRDEAIKNHLNVVIAGHISSDSLGMNLFLDKLSAKKIKIIPIGGLIRVKRK